MAKAKPLTPKSERRRKAWGSLVMSLQMARGLCPNGKCALKEGHASECWPK